MKILILNWRDIKNPLSGGAEILTQELAAGFVKKGHTVTQISAKFPDAKEEEMIDGVRIIRTGDPDARRLFKSVHFLAFKLYKKDFQGKVDLVIDEVHGIPFFTTLYVRERKVALICEIAGDLWNIAVGFPFNILGKIIEKIYPIFYKNIPIITISQSSKIEIEKNGFSKSQVKVIPMGSNSNVVTALPRKEKDKTIIFVSRLSRTKGVIDAIKAVGLIKENIPEIKLWIIGRGEDYFVNELKKLVKDLDLLENVKFLDFVSEEKKEELLTRAHLLIAPSVKEGWGLTVHEAGARATPAVVYNVPGLRDIVKENINGIICSQNNPENLSENIQKILTSDDLYLKLQKGAIDERKKHTWENTTDKFLEFANQ